MKEFNIKIKPDGEGTFERVYVAESSGDGRPSTIHIDRYVDGLFSINVHGSFKGDKISLIEVLDKCKTELLGL